MTETFLTLPLPPTVFWPLAFLALMAVAALAVFAFLPDDSRRERRPTGWLAKTGIPPGLAIPVGLAFAILFILALWASFATLWTQITTTAPDSGAPLGTSALIAALLGAPFILWRSLVAQRTVNIAQESHITDLIAKAVEQLGAEKTVKRIVKTDTDTKSEEETVPNLEVRIGAILALERLARQNLDVHVQIMEILTAYIRENAKAKDAPKLPEPPEYTPDDHAGWKKAFDLWRADIYAALTDIRPREDIQKALSVVGRRSAGQRAEEARWQNPDRMANFVFDDLPQLYPDVPTEDYDPLLHDEWVKSQIGWQNSLQAYMGYKIDLRRSCLRSADLTGLNLAGALFDEALMEGALLTGTQLQGARLIRAHLQGAKLVEAQLRGARLNESKIHGAELVSAHMEGTSLYRAKAYGARLDGARLQGGRLRRARMYGAILDDAQLQGASLDRARLQGVSLYRACMQGASLSESRLQNTRLSKAQMQWAWLKGTQFNDKTNLSTASIGGVVLRNMDLRQSIGFLRQIGRQLPSLFADGSVLLPADHPRPAHWPVWELEQRSFDAEYAKWRASPSTYTPPPPPA